MEIKNKKGEVLFSSSNPKVDVHKVTDKSGKNYSIMKGELVDYVKPEALEVKEPVLSRTEKRFLKIEETLELIKKQLDKK